MKILGLGLGFLATAAVSIDGKIVAAASEERFSKKKNQEGYPAQAVTYCLRQAGISGADLDLVIVAGNAINPIPWITRNYSSFSIADHVRAQREYWYPTMIEGRKVSWLEVFADKADYDQFPGNWRDILGEEGQDHGDAMWKRLRPRLFGAIAEHIGVDEGKITQVDHHTCHAAYAYWGSPMRDGKCLVMTADAWGDGVSATIGIAENGRVNRIKTIPHDQFMLGRIYRYITLLLGMKPAEHEYKVMGLAPYSKEVVSEGPYQAFKETMYVDKLDFKWKVRPKDLYFHFRDRLEGFRFDGIAGGLQRYTEEILTQWISNAVAETGVHSVVFSGGVSMNVKANMELHSNPEIHGLYVCPSGGDESLPIGACYHHETSAGTGATSIIPFQPYQGPDYGPAEVRDWVSERKLADRYDVTPNVTNASVAEHLAAGKVIGRMVGRMEFGARSLGNRSILADPRSVTVVEKINRMIKQRDFWMPFAPTILAEHADRYLVNPKGIEAPFMTIGFHTTDLGREHLPAGLHVSDKTARPQILKREHNPEYHDLISEFCKLTGVGAVLNTSFNLHGYPIVMAPDDALFVFENSEIDAILVADTLIAKRTTEQG